jgi:hypothetical protein
MSKRLSSPFANFTQISFANSLNGINAAAVSDALLPASYFAGSMSEQYFPPTAYVLVRLEGVITSAEVAVSIGITDANDVEGWSVPQVAEIRALPDGDGTKVVSLLSFKTLYAKSLRVALESAIAGGGAVKIYLAFEDIH